MRVRNVHSRALPVSPDKAGTLLDSLSGDDDQVWPRERWPAMRFDRPLGVGARGGHGPIGYHVVEYERSSRIRFVFTQPTGMHGYHEWEIRPAPGGCEVRHALVVNTAGLAVVTWPLLLRPLHNALIEDALDKADLRLCGERPASQWHRHLAGGRVNILARH